MVAENDDQFLKTSLLEVLVPQATNLNINKLLPPKPENCDNVVSSVERRDLLYFGMFNKKHHQSLGLTHLKVRAR